MPILPGTLAAPGASTGREQGRWQISGLRDPARVVALSWQGLTKKQHGLA